MSREITVGKQIGKQIIGYDAELPATKRSFGEEMSRLERAKTWRSVYFCFGNVLGRWSGQITVTWCANDLGIEKVYLYIMFDSKA